MNVTVREATENDIQICSRLLDALFGQDLEFKPDRNLQIQGLTQVINSPPIGKIFVAETENMVVGMVSLLFSISTVLGGKVATLEDMIIEASHRKKGIGCKKMQTEAFRWT